MRIGVFDSGLGGLTIVKVMMEYLHGAQIIYIADTAHAPYGEKSAEEILALSIDLSEYLLEHYRIDALVIACNTATSAAVSALRARYRDLIIVGTEPALKPAMRISQTHRIGVLATPATLRGAKYRALVDRLIEGHYRILEQPCPGLVQQIEAGQIDTPATRAMLTQWLDPMREAHVDTIVLGCTHYPLVGETIASVMGYPITLVESATGVSRHLAQLIHAHRYEGPNRLTLLCTGPIVASMVEQILGYPHPIIEVS